MEKITSDSGELDILGIEIEGIFTDALRDGLLETRDVGDGYEMMIELGGYKEKLVLKGADEAEAKELHQYAKELIEKNPGASLSGKSYAEYVAKAVEAKRNQTGSIH